VITWNRTTQRLQTSKLVRLLLPLQPLLLLLLLLLQAVQYVEQRAKLLTVHWLSAGSVTAEIAALGGTRTVTITSALHHAFHVHN